MREKLIDLVRDAIKWHPTIARVVGETDTKRIADHLIANGVTFATDNNVGSKWIPVLERLPEKDGRYATVCNFGNGVTSRGFLSFAKDGKKVDYNLTGKKNVWYEFDREWGFVSIDSVTHWMPLPEPPKEG